MREKRNKVFGKVAEKGKTSMGWFFGFKMHMIINDIDQMMAIKVTKDNVNDRMPVAEITKKLKGSIYTDKGYIGAGLFKALYKRGLKLITGIRKNVKNYLIDLTDKKLLRKRFSINFAIAFLSMNEFIHQLLQVIYLLLFLFGFSLLVFLFILLHIFFIAIVFRVN